MWLLALLGFFIGSALLVASARVDAHWAGFQYDLWYCKDPQTTFEGQNSDYQVLGPAGSCYTYDQHSYGFNSATNVSVSNQGNVCARTRRETAYGTIVFSGCGWNYVRTCYDGVYPNCHDIDGTSWIAEARNASSVNLRMKGHGAY